MPTKRAKLVCAAPRPFSGVLLPPDMALAGSPAEGEEAWGPALPNPGTGTRATASVPHTVHCPGDRWDISFFLLSESNTQAEGSFS